MTEDKHLSGAPWRNFYGRFKGKTMRDSQFQMLDEDLDALSPGPVGWEENPDRVPLDLEALFAGRDLWLEIGFGAGEHMVHQAATNPDVGIVGCEPFLNGVAMALGKIRKAGVSNIRIHPGDVRNLFDVELERLAFGRAQTADEQRRAAAAAAPKHPTMLGGWSRCVSMPALSGRPQATAAL